MNRSEIDDAPNGGAGEKESGSGMEDLSRGIEALLFSAGEPLSMDRLKTLSGVDDAARVREAIDALNAEYEEGRRSFAIERVAGGFRLMTRPEYAPWVEQLGRREREARLSPAALETLAVIAYRQPVLRADVEKVRGVDVSGAIRTLLERGLVKVVGRAEEPGNPLLYGTTRRFLSVFGLNGLSDLPRKEDLRN